MQKTSSGQCLHEILVNSLDAETYRWLSEKRDSIVNVPSSRELFMAYTLLGSKINGRHAISYPEEASEVQVFLKERGAGLLEIARNYLLVSVLQEDPGFFTPKVAQLIQLADTGELISFLRYLILMPDPAVFRQVAVEALRTNIATVFDAISLDNPYPSKFFEEQQWNQMYLKAAFMQRDLSKIQDIDKRANKDLARIISDYAHERWAANRDVDPYFWRPVSNFLEGVLLTDMQRLLESNNATENKAAALCCYYSSLPKANALLDNHPKLKEQINAGMLNWDSLKE